jgi:catechol 2,3-dioxygenase-like lactoylglutathione lyase family enzyme
MMAYAFAMPVLPGKAEAARRFVAEVLGPRRADWDDLQRRQGVTRESYFLQHDPDGDLFIVTGEGSFTPISEWLEPEGIPFDRWFAEQVQDVTGVDVRELGGDPPEHLGDWQP